MAFARDSYTATAAQTDFTITFPYLSTTHVTVYVDGVLQTEGAGDDYTIVSSTIVRFNSGLVGGEVVLLIRVTSHSSRLVDYVSPSTLTEADMDNDSLQAFYMVQESIDAAATALGVDATDLWDAGGIRITDVGTPSADADAATKAYVDAAITGAGNVPAPANPGEDNYLLAASGGSWLWAALTAAMIPNDLIDSQHYAAGSIDLEHMSANSVDSDQYVDGSIDTAHLADDAVTLAKIAAGVDGELITWDAAGNPATVPVGTAGQVLTSNGAGAAPTMQSTSGFTSSYTSSAQTITSAGSLALAHGLGAMPTLIQLRLKCTTAEFNYSVDDELIINPGISTTGTQNRGVAVVPDSTNVNIRFGSAASAIEGMDKTSGALAALTNASWNLIVRAWV
jgi:hypothetical protein